MNHPLTGKKTGKPRILVAPLDWGLGHATRCIPVIRELLQQGCDVWLAGEGMQEELLKMEFPQLPFLHLQGYRVKYSRSSAGMLWSMLRQSRSILSAIRAEHQWLIDAVTRYQIDAVVSDNRFGLYHASIPSVFITHQLKIRSTLGAWSEKWLRQKNYRYINRFSQCWVPDNKDGHSLAGQLSHPATSPKVPVLYTGPLSRFEPDENEPEEKKGHLLVILSGPEPQRTLLEDKIVNEISHYAHTATVVRGLPGTASLIPSSNTICFYNHLPANDLMKEMLHAEFIIARSGYSTVMDIAALGKRSILVPTPGQTEQEYLAGYLSAAGFAPFLSQKKFSLSAAIELAAGFGYRPGERKKNVLLAAAISSFIAAVSVN